MEHNRPLDHIQVGKLGESIAAKFLRNKDQQIICRNYRKSFGEIDIVSRETNGIIHFVEVKTVSYETREDLMLAVTRRTFRPEEHIDNRKLKRLGRTIEAWLLENPIDQEWIIDVVAVRVVPREKYAKISLISGVIFDY